MAIDPVGKSIPQEFNNAASTSNTIRQDRLGSSSEPANFATASAEMRHAEKSSQVESAQRADYDGVSNAVGLTEEQRNVARARDAEAKSVFTRFKNGELDREGYINGRIDCAMKHIVGRVSEEQQSQIRESLRQMIENDPGIAMLVAGATGK